MKKIKSIKNNASLLPLFIQRILKRMYVQMVSLKRGFFGQRLSQNEYKLYLLFKMIISNEETYLENKNFILRLGLRHNTYTLDSSTRIIFIDHDDYSSQFYVSDFLIHKIQVMFEGALNARENNRKVMHLESQGRTLDAIILDVTVRNAF